MKRFSKFKKVISITRNKKRWVAVSIVLILLLSVLFILLPNFKDERVSACMGTRGERSGRIFGEPLVQPIKPSGPTINYIELRFANCDYNEGTVTFTIYDKDEAVIYNKQVAVADLVSDDYYRFDVNLHVKKNGSYKYTVLCEGTTEARSPRLWVSNNVPDECGEVEFPGHDPEIRMQASTQIAYAQFHYLAFAISLISILSASFSALLVLHIDKARRKVICYFILALMPVVSFLLVEILNANSITNKIFAAYFVNYILYFLIYCFFFAITNKLRFAVLFSNTAIFILALINFYKLEFRGEPLSLSDVASFKTAMNVAGEYEIKLSYIVIMTACLFMLVTAVVSRFRYSMRKIKSRIGISALCLTLGTLMVFALFDTDRYSTTQNSIMKKLGIVNNVWNQPLNYTDNGMIVAITMNAQYLKVKAPAVYSEQGLADVEADVSDNYGTNMLTDQKITGDIRRRIASTNKPNIICIMNESYSDFSQFGDIELSQPYSPFIDSLSENTIKGDCYVSTYGGGTANSEFEFLTGNSMTIMPNGSIPYQQYIDDDAGSLSRVLKGYGYTAYAVHPYLASGWNRPDVYNYMAFDRFYSIDDFQEPEYIRSYISDSCSYKKVIELFEKNEQECDNPFFCFNVTMQNHGSYTKTYANFEPDVSYVPDPGAYPQAEQYFSVARHSDEAIQELIEYFQNVDEPTVICFFGDHLPSFKDGFYENILGVKDVAELSPEEMQKLYITDYFIWANYDIPEKEINAISLNYLSTLVMQVAGLPMTEYQMFLSDLYELYPVVTTMGICDKDGNYIAGKLEMLHKDLWNYYSVLEYNNVFGDDERASYIFDIPYYEALKFKARLNNTDALPAATTTATTETKESDEDN
ncbi:MAG: sulfatase-like hydrolase/transferase [Clostridiales bacterium]|nr:sulfatase-like hydrolase/transferase [Clostridiales bacterium]